MRSSREGSLTKARLASSSAALAGVVVLLVARPAFAEVMDKELAPSDLVRTLALALLLAVVAAAVHRWLLVPAFLFGPVRTLAMTWTEAHAPFVGPAIAREAGSTYGLMADAALASAIVAHVALWFLSRSLRQRAAPEPRHSK